MKHHKLASRLIAFYLLVISCTVITPAAADTPPLKSIAVRTSRGERIVLNIPESYPLTKDSAGAYFVPAMPPFQRSQARSGNPYPSPLNIPERIDLGVIGSDDRVKVADTTVFPYSAVVHINQRHSDGTDAICTGWLFGRNVVATAAHCIYESGVYFKGVYTITPGYNASSATPAPFGSCSPKLGVVLEEYVNPSTPASQKSTYDFGIIQLNCDLGDLTGWVGFRQLPALVLSTLKVRVTGYPGLEQWQSNVDCC